MTRSIAALIAVLVVAGCGTIGTIADLIGNTVPDPPEVYAIATYTPLVPGADLGMDGLGNYWIRHSMPDTLCEIISFDGQTMIEIRCPAEGDTLR